MSRKSIGIVQDLLNEQPKPFTNFPRDHTINDEELLEIRQDLLKLDNLEEKLGMPLDKFFEALDGSTNCEKVYVQHPHKGLQEMFLSGFEYHHNEGARWFNAFNLECGSCTLGLSEYGKTWAFTKEELEK